ncbi:MAG TPA: amidohydrolase family protein [bacterium]|nr:amidohydrolase family protein [bacterium]
MGQDLDLSINNGLVVAPQGRVHADIGIREGKIVALAGSGELGRSKRTIDASGKWVLPGVIDPHVHFHMWERPFEGDVISETRAAAAGGVTTIGLYVLLKDDGQTAAIFERGGGRIDSAAEYREEYERHAVVDAYLQVMLPEENLDRSILAAHREGIRFFKVTWGRKQFNDKWVLRAFETIARLGKPCRAMVHAENLDLCEEYIERVRSSGRNDPAAWTDGRPSFCEAEHMDRYIRLAVQARCPLYFVHITIGEGVDIVARAKAQGADVIGETCPQYLTHTVDTPVFQRAPQLAKVNPPIRDAASNQKLWDGLGQGILECVGSDHSPRTLAEKKGTVWEVPPGLGNTTEMILPVLISEGVSKGRLSLEQAVAISAYNPARRFGLYPRKGVLCPGSDADVVIVDPNKKVKLDASLLHSRSDYSIYEGWEFQGWPTCTIVRGRVVVEDGEIVCEGGTGLCLTS